MSWSFASSVLSLDVTPELRSQIEELGWLDDAVPDEIS
jgi:hypothetical protein